MQHATHTRTSENSPTARLFAALVVAQDRINETVTVLAQTAAAVERLATTVNGPARNSSGVRVGHQGEIVFRTIPKAALSLNPRTNA